MKKQIIRCLFGPPSETIHLEMKYLMESELKNHNVPFICYVFGKSHVPMLEKYGVSYRLLSEKEWIYPQAAQRTSKFGNKYVLFHKLLCLQAALQDFNEVVLLDWDCFPIKPLAENFWSELSLGHSLRVPIYCWSKKIPNQLFPGKWVEKNIWVPKYSIWPVDFYPLPNAGFVYIRGLTVIEEIIKIAKSLPDHTHLTDETSLALYIENEMGGVWPGLKKYYEKYEPCWCDGAVEGTGFNEQSALFLYTQRKGMRSKKEILFWHMAGEPTIRGFLSLRNARPSMEPSYLPTGRSLKDRIFLKK